MPYFSLTRDDFVRKIRETDMDCSESVLALLRFMYMHDAVEHPEVIDYASSHLQIPSDVIVSRGFAACRYDDYRRSESPCYLSLAEDVPVELSKEVMSELGMPVLDLCHGTGTLSWGPLLLDKYREWILSKD